MRCGFFHQHCCGDILSDEAANPYGGVDEKLRTAAVMARATLPEDYHDRLAGPASVSDGEYQRIVDRYNRICTLLGMEYLWSLMDINGAIVFTTSTSPDKEAKNRKHAAFFEKHSNPEIYTGTFGAMQPSYQINDDKWGRIRVALVPFHDSHGRPYLFGASIRLTEIDRQLDRVIYASLLVSACLLLGAVGVGALLAKSIIRPINNLSESIKSIAAGNSSLQAEERGSYEQIVLAESFNRLHAALQLKIAELKRSEKALTKSEESLSITLHSIGDAVIATDIDGRVTLMNSVAEHLTGWPLAEARDKVLSEVFHIVSAASRLAMEDPVKLVLESGQVVGLANHTVLISRGGTEYQIADSAAPIRDSDGAVRGVILVFSDITEKYAAQEALRESRQFLSEVIENNGALIYAKDREGRYELVNRKWEETTGLKREDAIGKTDEELMPSASGKAFREIDLEVMEGGSVLEREEILEDAAGKRYFLSIKFPLRDKHHAVKGLCGMSTDITARKQAEEELVCSLKEKEVMLKEIHHRVKNNMQVVYSLLNLQSKGIVDKPVRALFEEARDRVHSMALVHEKLYQSKDLAHIDFKNYLQNLIAGIADTYQRRDVAISVEMEPLALDVNVGIPCGLIVNELVSNSLKYAFPGGRQGKITLGINKGREGNNVLTVADNGVGFPDTVDFRNTVSLGLQLVVVLAGQIHGTIELAKAGGTAFSITFPGVQG